MCATPMLGLASRSRVNPSGRSMALAVAKPVMVPLRSGAPPFSAMDLLRVVSSPRAVELIRQWRMERSRPNSESGEERRPRPPLPARAGAHGWLRRPAVSTSHPATTENTPSLDKPPSQQGRSSCWLTCPGLGGAMDVPADQSTPTSGPLVHPTPREAVRSPRRRWPTGAPPPLPHRLQTSGVGWLVAAVLVYRALTWGLPILVGVACYLWWRRSRLRPQPVTAGGPRVTIPQAEAAASGDPPGTQASASRPRAYVRHPGDVLRVVLGALLLLATMTAIDQDRIGIREADVFRVVNDLALPGWTKWPVWLVMQLGVIGAVPLVALLALATRRLRLAAYAALAGGTIYLIAKLVKEFVQRGRPQTLLDNVYIFDVPDRGLGYVSGHSAVAVALATVASPFLGRRARRDAWVLAALVCVARIYVGSHLPFDVLGRAALGWAAGSLVLLVFGAPTGQPSLERVRAALQTYGFDPADLAPLPGQDRRSARYLAASHSRPDLFVKVVTRERRDSDLLYRAWDWLRHRGRPPSRLGDAVAQVEHEASMGLLAAAAEVRAPPVLLVRSFGNGAGLLVQQRDQARLADLWGQVARLRKARIAHRDLGLGSVMVDEHGRVWLVDFDRAEAAANQALLDHDVATLLAALDGVADPTLVRATAEQALGQDTIGHVLPPAVSTPATSIQAAPEA